jgi:serine/threonine protein kinase
VKNGRGALELVAGELLGDARGEGRWRAVERLCLGRSFDVWLVDDQHLDGVRAAAKVIRYASTDAAHRAARRSLFEAERDVYLLPSSLLPEPLDWLAVGEGEEPVLVYELAAGETLEALVQQRAPSGIGVARAARIVRELALHCAELHAAGFVMRDLSPAHVVVGLDDTLQVVGLGNVVRAGALAPEQAHKESRLEGFAAPELAQATRVEPAADSFALGSLLAFLAAGRADAAVEPALATLVSSCRADAPSARPNARAIHESLRALTRADASRAKRGVAAAAAAPAPSRAPAKEAPTTPALAEPAKPPSTAPAPPPKRDEKKADAGEKKTKASRWPWIVAALAAAGGGAAFAYLKLTGRI